MLKGTCHISLVVTQNGGSPFLLTVKAMVIWSKKPYGYVSINKHYKIQQLAKLVEHPPKAWF